MNISSSMRDFILEASYQYKSPIDENRTEINLLQNASLWEEAYYIQAQNDEYNGLSRCVRLTSPIERLTYPNDLWVTKLTVISLQTLLFIILFLFTFSWNLNSI